MQCSIKRSHLFVSHDYSVPVRRRKRTRTKEQRVIGVVTWGAGFSKALIHWWGNLFLFHTFSKERSVFGNTLGFPSPMSGGRLGACPQTRT